MNRTPARSKFAAFSIAAFSIAAWPLLLALAGCMSSMSAPPAPPATPPPPAAAADDASSAIARAVADADRPADDSSRDAARKPAQILEFAGVRPGQRVLDFIPGGGYFTRLFAKAVGANGHVYAAAPPPNPSRPGVETLIGNPGYMNVSLLALTGPLTVPEPVDLIFTAQNYHDLHLTQLKLDVPAMTKALFDALKPGGVLVVIDHAALPGTGLDVPNTLHRIDEEIVKKELAAAGFVLDGSSNALRNAADTRTVNVFDAAIRGSTDQFVLRFRKPG